MKFPRNLLSWLFHRASNLDERVTIAHDYIPKVSRDDVLRIVRRDYGIERMAEVIAILDLYGPESWHVERERVHLSILKLSEGSAEKLRHFVEVACNDLRDVVAPAEYPRFFDLGFVGVENLPEADVRKLKKDDWQQYRNWLDAV